MDIFETCHVINEYLLSKNEFKARNELIKLLDYHLQNKISYSSLVNHLIRETGLYPYLETDTANWQDRFVFEAFKVDTGDDEPLTLHREQSAVLSKLINGEDIAISAPTSFGKSFIVDAYISINNPDNVVIIVPTIALTDETRRRLYKKFANKYKIITTTDIELATKNIFIFPQERAINYANKIKSLDLLIVDEFYKASAIFEKERSSTLLKAILQLSKIAKQRYFLAPNISELIDSLFTKGMKFYPLDFNTVYLEQYKLYDEIKNDDTLKSQKLLEILAIKEAKTLIYAGTYANINRISNLLISSTQIKDRFLLNNFANWLSENYDVNWNLTNLVRRGTGIHNGKLHRSLSQIQIKLFEETEGLDNIISTSSIIEGVNTSAENVVIWANKSGRVKLNDFTYKNIIGRGGRMFKHFVGKIYILASPPKEEQTQLEIPFPDEILGGIYDKEFIKILTREQIAKINYYKEEMANILGPGVIDRLYAENVFQTSDSELIKKIALDMRNNPYDWFGLGYLNTKASSIPNWNYILLKIINLNRNGWDTTFSRLIEFVKVLRNNWYKSIPELLSELEPHDISVEDFFKLERVVTFKLASLLADINILQKELLVNIGYDISKFITHLSHAFLPPVVYQLEEFGLPRMISKKIHMSGLINFYDPNLDIHATLALFKEISIEGIILKVDLNDFDKYILDYFYDGIKTNS